MRGRFLVADRVVLRRHGVNTGFQRSNKISYVGVGCCPGVGAGEAIIMLEGGELEEPGRNSSNVIRLRPVSRVSKLHCFDTSRRAHPVDTAGTLTGTGEIR